MIEIANLEEWTKEYFSDPENQKKAEKACERYDRLMVKNIKRQLSGGAEKIFLNEEPADDPGKCMEKAKYEVIPFAKVDGKNGKVKINMLDQTLICRRQGRRPQKEDIPHICDFSRGSLNVRLCARIQTLLRGHICGGYPLFEG